MFEWATGALLVTVALVLGRAVAGPSLFDRILAVNMAGTKMALFVALFGFLTDRPAFLDMALVYALINFIVIFAVLRFIRFRGLNDEHVYGTDPGDV